MQNLGLKLLFLGASFALLMALGSQYGFGFHPCELCIYQRVPLFVVVFLTVYALARKCPHRQKIILLISSFILLIGAAIAAFHFGVEQKWWEGFSTCSGVGSAGNIEDLKAQILAAPTVRCDEATWILLGLSMAGWNVLYSAALSLIGFYALWKKK